jgi:hypothetical protein
MDRMIRSTTMSICVAACALIAVSRAAGDETPRERFYLPPRDGQKVVDAARAEQLFVQGRAAAEASKCSTAARLAYETLHQNPDHAAARKLLGYRKVGEHWVTEFGAAKLAGGSVWHAKFGWLKSDQVARYEGGERFLNGRWVPAAVDAAFRTTIDKGWDVDTEHFRLKTNVSLEEGVRLAGRLESLYHVWRQLFARFHTHEDTWRRLYAGGDPPKSTRRLFPVVYYRSKDEYVADLKKDEPRIEMTSGIFLNNSKTAYFYADATTNNDSYLFHEVVHQLFMLSKFGTSNVAARGNFWIVEGVACYFESLALHDDYAELGDLKNARIVAARHRRLVDDFYVPLAEYTTYSMQTFQHDQRLPRLYSQASGLSWFLLLGDGLRYREATADYLSDIYAGKDTPTTLAERTGRTYAELDRDYHAYLQRLP